MTNAKYKTIGTDSAGQPIEVPVALPEREGGATIGELIDALKWATCDSCGGRRHPGGPCPPKPGEQAEVSPVSLEEFNRDLARLNNDMVVAAHREEQREEALRELADERLAGTTSGAPPRKKMTVDEADAVAQKHWNELKLINNQSAWARTIGCGRKLVRKLPTWNKAAEWRRDYRAGIRKKLQRIASAEFLAVLSGDKSVIASLSDEDREKWDDMSDEQRAKLCNILSEDDE